MTFSAYKEHPVRALLGQLLDFQHREELADPLVADNEQAAFARDKIFAIGHLVEGLLSQTPATLASTTALSNLHSHLQAPVNELNAFVSNRNVGHLTNAATHCEQNVLPLLWGLPQQISNIGGTALAELIQGQAKMSSNTLHQLVEQRDELATRLKELLGQSETLAARLESTQEATTKERAEAAAAVANLQKAFAEKEIERATAFETASGSYKQDHEKLRESLATDAQLKLDDLEEQQVKAARIVQVVGNIGVTGNYQQIANSEAGQANFWRWVTVAVFGVGIFVAISTFVKFWDHPFSTENMWSIAIRLLYAVAITAPAWYTARESARHRTNSDRARQTELELASIGPFIELMPEDKKVAIREALTRCYFGNPTESHQVQTPLDATSLKELLELVKMLRK